MKEEIFNPSRPLALFETLQSYPYAFFLDSSAIGEKLGRFSFLGCDPFLVFKSKKDAIELEWNDGRHESFRSNPFHYLKRLFEKYKIPEDDSSIPFTSGAVGYFAYDMKDFIEELPDISDDDLALPDCILGFYDVVIIYDHLEKRAHIASSGFPETEESERKKRGSLRLKDFKNRISKARETEYKFSPALSPSLKSNFSYASYAETIKKAKAYIKKGDIYQVNLSQRFQTTLNMEPVELYSRLRDFSPAPFSSYLDFKDVLVLSSSPERYLLKKGDYIHTRPIKGTRPRGKDKAQDLSLVKELISSDKDRAEHIMIVDLERNDLGRICEYGSVNVEESIVLEKYANVFHLVSTVAGRLKEDVGPIDCFVATFPGGSITGAPKIRSMEIIEELEPVKRSVYTGAIGYISFDGNMDTSIVIRTFIIKGKDVYFQVGGGIVADSDPEKEYEETIHKARGLMRSIGIDTAKEPIGI